LIKGLGVNYSNYHAGFNPAPSYAYAAFVDTASGVIPTLKQAQPYKLTVNTNTSPVLQVYGLIGIIMEHLIHLNISQLSFQQIQHQQIPL